MASRYKQFLQLCEKWPLDKTKIGRDLGAVIRDQVGKAFKSGEASVVNEKECDEALASLRRINSNHYKTVYAMPEHCKGFTQLTVEQCRQMNSNENMQKHAKKRWRFW